MKRQTCNVKHVNIKRQACKSPHKKRVKTKNFDACVTLEKEHVVEARIKFPHVYYYMQAVIQVFHETLLARRCHYIRPSPSISNSNRWTSFYIMATLG